MGDLDRLACSFCGLGERKRLGSLRAFFGDGLSLLRSSAGEPDFLPRLRRRGEADGALPFFAGLLRLLERLREALRLSPDPDRPLALGDLFLDFERLSLGDLERGDLERAGEWLARPREAGLRDVLRLLWPDALRLARRRGGDALRERDGLRERRFGDLVRLRVRERRFCDLDRVRERRRFAGDRDRLRDRPLRRRDPERERLLRRSRDRDLERDLRRRDRLRERVLDLLLCGFSS